MGSTHVHARDVDLVEVPWQLLAHVTGLKHAEVVRGAPAPHGEFSVLRRFAVRGAHRGKGTAAGASSENLALKNLALTSTYVVPFGTHGTAVP